MNDNPVGVRCVRAIWVLADDEGNTWLAPGQESVGDGGGIMPDLRTGDTPPATRTAQGRLKVRVAESGPWSESELTAYPVDADLLRAVLAPPAPGA